MVCCIGGIILVYRDNEFIKQEQLIEKQLPRKLKPQGFGKALYLRNMMVLILKTALYL